MATPKSARKSLRSVPTVRYDESPIESPKAMRKSARKSILQAEEKSTNDSPNRSVRAKSVRKSMVRNLSEEKESAKEDALDENEPKTPKRRGRPRKVEEPEEHSPKKLRANRTPSSKALESIVTESSPTVDKLDSVSGRPVRARKSIPLYTEATKKPKYQFPEKDSPDASVIFLSDEESNASEFFGKPTTLFDEDEDVEGQRLYSLKTPKKKESMALLAQTTPKTPHHNHNERTPRTPKNCRLSEIQNTPTSRPSASKLAKTPRHVRDAIKKSKLKMFLYVHKFNFASSFRAQKGQLCRERLRRRLLSQ